MKAAQNAEYLAMIDRGIDQENRLVYHINENDSLWSIACKGHYED